MGISPGPGRCHKELCLSITFGTPISRGGAIARGTQLDLLHYVIETQRLVNAVPAAAGDRALEVVLERVQTVTNADGAAIEVADKNVMVHRAVSGLQTDPEGTRTVGDQSLAGLSVQAERRCCAVIPRRTPGSTLRPLGGLVSVLLRWRP